MTTEKSLPLTDRIVTTRFAADKIAEYALNCEKGHRPVDFIRPTASAERNLIARLSPSKLGEAALLQFGQEDTIVHIDSPS